MSAPRLGLGSEEDARRALRQWDLFHCGALSRLYRRWLTFQRAWSDPTIGDLLTVATAAELKRLGPTFDRYETVRWVDASPRG